MLSISFTAKLTAFIIDLPIYLFVPDIGTNKPIFIFSLLVGIIVYEIQQNNNLIAPIGIILSENDIVPDSFEVPLKFKSPVSVKPDNVGVSVYSFLEVAVL